MAITVYAALQAGIRYRTPKPGRGKAGQPKRVGLTQEQEDERKRHLRTVACSEYWVEAHFDRHTDVSPDGETLVYTTFNRKAFPPPADAAPMCKCARCTAMFVDGGHGSEQLKPQDIHAGAAICVDHLDDKFNIAYGPSPSGRAIAEVQHRNLRLEDLKLKSEFVSDLNREIAMYETGRHPLARKRLAKGKPLFLHSD